MKVHVYVQVHNSFKIKLHYPLSTKGVHTIAAVEGPEDYKTLKEGLAPVWAEVKELLEQG